MVLTMSEEKKIINLSKDLYKLLKKKAYENKFKSIDTYVEHVLGQVLHSANPEELDPEEEEEIKKRLEKLGYL